MTRRRAIPKSGLLRLSPAAYTAMRVRVLDIQNSACFRCGAYITKDSLHVHHHGGRGGGKRNDVPWFDERRGTTASSRKVGDARFVRGLCYGLCFSCHNQFHRGPQWSGINHNFNSHREIT